MGNELKYYLRRLMLAYYSFRFSVYYPVIFPLLLISLGALIFILFVIPQIESWFSIKDEVLVTQTKINVMKQNTYVLQSMNKYDADNNFNIATMALPPYKDFVGILNGINQAAAMSRVSLNDFDFTLGKIALGKNLNKSAAVAIPIEIQLKVQGDINMVSKFLTYLEQKLPIIEIRSISFAKNKTDLAVAFYIKPFPIVTLAQNEYVKGLTADEINLLSKLRSWSGQ